MSFASFFVKVGDFFTDHANNKHKFEGIEESLNIVYNDDHKDVCTLDVYEKKGVTGKYPVFLNIHGGSFVATDKKRRRGISRYFADKGFAVVNINYGLSPKFKYNEICAEAYSALGWIKRNADFYNFDLKRVVVSGDSAGGYIAASVAALSSNAEYREAMEVTDEGVKLIAAVLYCGVYDPSKMLEAKMVFNQQRILGRDVFGVDTRKELASYPDFFRFAITDFVTADYPPTFITHTDFDLMCPKQGGVMIDKLQQVGVPTWEFRAVSTKCMHVWQLPQTTVAARAALDATCEFLKERLSGKTSDRYFEI